METWDHEGEFFLTEGLLYIWWNTKLSDPASFHADPPVFVRPYHDWMTAHPDVEYYPTPMVGPPIWKFPTADLRTEFAATFLETKERMEEIIQEQVAIRKAEDLAAWKAQGEPRDEDGYAYFFSEKHQRNLILLTTEIHDGAH